MKKQWTRKLTILVSGALAVGLTLAFQKPAPGPAAATVTMLVVKTGTTGEPLLTNAAFGDIPMVYNEKVAQMIDAYSNRVHARFELGLVNAGKYEGLIRTAFQSEGLPEDLVYVAMIESSFRPNASSKARAQGIWQFANSTGRRFGLKSNSLIDERSDPAKATLAAAKFWKTLYGEYKDWNLAMAAYNAGEGRVSGAIRKTGINDYWDLCSQNALPKETCNYVPGVIAAATIARNPARYGFIVTPADAREFDTVTVDKPIDLRTLASKTSVKLDDLRELNPELRTTHVPGTGAGYPLVVPTEFRAAIESSLLTLPAIAAIVPAAFHTARSHSHAWRRGHGGGFIRIRGRVHRIGGRSRA
jgi:membrane-bound lytic murein transglycosylase D